MSDSVSINMPQPGLPFSDPDGKLSVAWYYFFLRLYERSGGSPPTPPVPVVLDQIAALFVEQAMTDDNPVPVRPATSVLFSQAFDDVSGATPQPAGMISLAYSDVMEAPRGPPAFLPVVMDDVAPVAPLNPILAALFVMDAP